MLGLVGTKVVVLVLMFVLSLACSLLPLVVRRYALSHTSRTTQMFMTGILCFGGGVLLGTVFLHLLPETRALLQQAVSLGFFPESPYPVAELIVCVGFFFIYITEEVVHGCLTRHHGPGGHSHSIAGHKGHQQDMEMARSPYKPKRRVSGASNDLTAEDPSLEKFMANGSDGDPDAGAEESLPMLRAVMMVAALSLHSIMEGLAMGLVHSPRDVWVLFGALSAHKLVIAFCMGMEMLEAGASRLTFFVSMTIFSVASPIGALIGTLVISLTTSTTAAGVLVPTVLQGLSAGTILYVTFCEVLERERAREGAQHIRVWSFLIGFIFLAGVQVLDSYVEEGASDPSTSAQNYTTTFSLTSTSASTASVLL